MYDPFVGKNPAEIDEIKASARSLINDAAFQAACKKLQHEYLSALMREQVGSLTSQTIHASMKVLEQVTVELSLLVADERLKQRRK